MKYISHNKKTNAIKNHCLTSLKAINQNYFTSITFSGKVVHEWGRMRTDRQTDSYCLGLIIELIKIAFKYHNIINKIQTN